jgi:prepilin-type N-terminal cleavage/methylation domain-containing protein
MKLKTITAERGFTIIELMVALSVLSTIILMGTVILIQIGALYTKGVNTANLQSTARSIIADSTSSLQFSGRNSFGCTLLRQVACYSGTPLPVIYPGETTPTTIYSFCIGDNRYSYVLDRKLGTDHDSHNNEINTPHVLWRDTLQSASATCDPLDISVATVQADGTSREAITPDGGVDSVGYEMLGNNMRLTRFLIQPQGADGKLFTASIFLTYGDNDLLHTDAATGYSSCSGDTGTQFCAISHIDTVINSRLY